MSNKLTFSFASLVLLIAFGLVFAPMSVMAHPNVLNNADPPASTNDHPADTPANHMHPMIRLSAKDANLNVAGTQVEDSDTATAGIQFTLMITVPENSILDDTSVAAGAPAFTLSGFGPITATSSVMNVPTGTVTAIKPVAVTDKPLEFTAPIEITFAGADDAAKAAAQATAIADGLMVTITLPAGDLKLNHNSGLYKEQLNLETSFTVSVVSMSVQEIQEATVTGTPSITMPFMITITFPKENPVDLMADDIDVTNGFIIGGSLTPNKEDTATTPTTMAKTIWTAVVQPNPAAKSVSVTIDSGSKRARASATNGSISSLVDATVIDPTAPDSTELALPTVSIAGAGFGVFTSASTGHGIDADNGTIATISPALRDLADFFLNGGTIALIGPTTATKGDLVISEIMWGRDGGMTKSQWIEIYNTKSTAGSTTGYKLQFLGPGVNAPATAIDVAGNYGPTGYWAPKGQSGRSEPDVTNNLPAMDIISMYRKIDYTKVEKTHNATDGTANRKTQLEGVLDGTAAGNWEVSPRPSVNLMGRRIGTPGAQHFDRTPDTATAYTQDILINEIGNGAGDANDWVELLNTTGSEINVKNWALSIVTEDAAGAATETNLLIFPDNDNTKIPANGILLLTNTDPTNSGNDLAAGVEINVAADDQVKRGATSLYYVASDVKIPDSGKTLLVLRNAKDKVGKPDNIVDAGGTLFHAVRNAVKNTVRFNTEVWPLHATAKGHGDVVDGDPPEDFRAGHVYKRGGKNSGIGEHHWAKVGFTGIGYDRRAAKTDENGGTPGYPNDGLKEKIADLDSDTEISISEVMVDAGPGRRSLPQWIEIYNSSMTQAVNLNEWKLEIQNANTEDVDARLNATITLGAMTISPNQTVLIVSSRGLNSGGDHFPATRTVILWTTKAHREALEMTSIGDRILSSTGFYLKLTDKDKKVVDEVGNIDGNRRTADDPAWTIPRSSQEGRRSSIIRVYEDGVARPGRSAGSWVSASDTSLAFAISHTYYGSADDFGTPGFRGGGPLPVSLSSFRPVRDKATGAVVIRWTTESELDNAGFNILRSETKTGEFKVVNLKGIIPGHGTTSEKHTYTFTDTTAKPNLVYYYQIEDVSLDGKRTTLATTHLRGNVTAAGKVTTTWGDLKSR